MSTDSFSELLTEGKLFKSSLHTSADYGVPSIPNPWDGYDQDEGPDRHVDLSPGGESG